MTRQKNGFAGKRQARGTTAPAVRVHSPALPGYPLLGCSSALPNSVSPGNMKHNPKQSSATSKPAKRAHRLPATAETRKILPTAPCQSVNQEEITGRNPTIHWLVSTRPSVAGFNAPRDIQEADRISSKVMSSLNRNEVVN